MKKIDFSNALNGQTLGVQTVEHMQNATIETARALVQGLTDVPANTVVMLTSFTVAGANITIPAGWAYYNGEVFEVVAYSGTAVVYWHIQTTHLSIDPIRFNDNQFYNVHQVRKLILNATAAESIGTFTAGNNLRSLLFKDEAWKKVGDPGNLQWTNPNPNVNIAVSSLFYKKDALGRINFRGTVTFVPDVPQSSPGFVLTEELYPVEFTTINIFGNGSGKAARVKYFIQDGIRYAFFETTSGQTLGGEVFDVEFSYWTV